MLEEDDSAHRQREEQEETAFLRRIQPELDQMEIVRQVKRDAQDWRQKMIWPIGAAVLACTLVLDYLLMKGLCAPGMFHCRSSGFPLPVLTLIAGCGLWIWANRPKDDYVRIYKENIIPRIAQMAGLTHYDPAGKLPLSDMRDSRILPGYEYYDSEDYFEGAYKGARIRFAQVKFSKSQRRYVSRYDRRRYDTITVFQGIALLIGLPQPAFQGHTILIRNASAFGEWMTGIFSGLQKTELAAPGLESVYTAFTSSPAEAARLLDREMLRRVMRLSEVFASKGVSLAFFRGQVFALVASDKNFFEPGGVNVSATNLQAVRDIRREVGQVMGLIDYLQVLAPASVAEAAP